MSSTTLASHGQRDDLAPVPQHERVLSGVDLAILWGDFGIGVLVLVTGSLLVPALGFTQALLAIVIGSVIGAGLLAMGGYIGAREGVPTMVLFRPVLGIKGSWLPSVLNTLQLVGWTAVELWAMSSVADLVTTRVFGVSARPLWLAVVTIACTALALWGPVGVVRVYLRKFGAWVVVAICLVVTAAVLLKGGTMSVLSAPGHGGFPSFGAAIDLVVSMPVSWLPLVADYNRFARQPNAALAGTLVGYLIANVWLYALGAMLILQSSTEPSPAGMAAGILAIGGGTLAGTLLIVGLLVGETDEAFADLYSGTVSLQNVLPRLPRRGTIVVIALIAALLAAFLTMASYETFLFLLGSVFVPLFGVLAADFVLGDRGHNHGEGSQKAWRLTPFAGWLAGFLTYHWIAPTGPTWWLQAMQDVFGMPLSIHIQWLPASIPSFLVAFAFGWATMRGREGRGLAEAKTELD